MFKMYLGASNILLTVDMLNYFYSIQLNLKGLANHEFLVIFCSDFSFLKPRHLNQNHAAHGNSVAAGFKNRFNALYSCKYKTLNEFNIYR